MSVFQLLERRRLSGIRKKQMQCLLLLLLIRKQRRKIRRITWEKHITKESERQRQYHGLMQELRLNDHETFVSFNRMTPDQFDKLLNILGPTLTKQTTFLREPISPAERLSITLRYLATGDCKRTISVSYRIAYSTTCQVIYETCLGLWSVLQPVYLKSPSRKHLLTVANEYWEKWKFPNCVGPIDARQIKIQLVSRHNSVSPSICQTPNVVLFASCDTSYRFTFIDVEDHEKPFVSYSSSAISHLLDSRMLLLPKPRQLPNFNKVLSFFFIANEKFPLKEYTMKPYPHKVTMQPREIFNFRLHRTLKVLENALGVLSSRWHIFRCQVNAKPDHVIAVVKAACCLHNFLLSEDFKKDQDSDFLYLPPRYVDYEVGTTSSMQQGEWRMESGGDSAFSTISRLGSNMFARKASRMRDSLAEFFLTPSGEIPQQYNMVPVENMEADSTK